MQWGKRETLLTQLLKRTENWAGRWETPERRHTMSFMKCIFHGDATLRCKATNTENLEHHFALLVKALWSGLLNSITALSESWWEPSGSDLGARKEDRNWVRESSKARKCRPKTRKEEIQWPSLCPPLTLWMDKRWTNMDQTSCADDFPFSLLSSISLNA